MPRHFRERMPEGGLSFQHMFAIHHECKGTAAAVAETGDEDIDLVIFPVGVEMEGLPANSPTIVTTVAPCDVCGNYLRALFTFEAPLYIT